MMRILGTLGAAFLVAASLVPTSVQAQESADMVVHNGTIFTADNLLSIHSAMATKDGKVVALGGEELLDRYRATCVIDLRDRFVVPGFNDSHTHIRGYPQRYVDMGGVRSIAEFQQRLRAKAEELGPGEWITGYGWSEDEISEKRKPTRWDLDQAVPNHPTVISRAGGHSAVLNSRALELAGIDRDTPDPEGGNIEHDESGEPTGIIRENWEAAARLIPEPAEEELRASLIQNLRSQFAYGITSVIEASTSPERFAMWRDIYEEHRGELPRAAVQIRLPVGFDEGEAVAARLRDLDLRTGQGDEQLRVGGLKLFVDGGFTGPAAWTLEPYPDQPDYSGHPQLSEDDFYGVAKTAHQLGWQLGVHAIGDAAIAMAVEQITRVLDELPRVDHRHYLNHFTVLPPEQTMRDMADYDILIAQQPNFTWTLEGRYKRHLSGERLRTNNALRTPMDHGIFVALGADILPTGPLLGIQTAATRRGMSGEVIGAEEVLSVPEAIVGYTRNGAYLTWEEELKGTLEPGKLADFVVLSEDLRRIDPSRIRDVEVELTVLGGKVVYAGVPDAIPESCRSESLIPGSGKE